MAYSLKAAGDNYEQAYYDLLIVPHFLSYETFWDRFVTPLTNRPANVQLKTDAALAAIGKGHNDLCIAQLHYTVFRQLCRCVDLMRLPKFSINELTFGMSSLVGAQDCAFELLERFRNPAGYGPWLEVKTVGINGGREAQRMWKDNHSYPLQDIRDYRNNLVHGRFFPGIWVSGKETVPVRGRETSYLDWRLVTSPAGALPLGDFEAPLNVMTKAFNETAGYFETTWKSELIPNI